MVMFYSDTDILINPQISVGEKDQVFQTILGQLKKAFLIEIFKIQNINGWIDMDNQQQTILKNPQNSLRFVNKLNPTTIYTKNILNVARKYYNCKLINGMYLEYIDDFTSMLYRDKNYQNTLLWSGIYAFNDIFTNSQYTIQEHQVLSIFTIAALLDTGFFTGVNMNYAENMTFGKNRGCTFYSNTCNGKTKLNPEYVNKNLGAKYCDSVNFLYKNEVVLSEKNQRNGCKSEKKSYCYQRVDKWENTDKIQYFGEKSRCFISNASTNAVAQEDEGIRCIYTECNAGRVEIYLNQDSLVQRRPLICQNRAVLNINGVNDQNGTITCPDDSVSFCAVNASKLVQKCPNNCSMNGFCFQDSICFCLQGKQGEGCEINCQNNTCPDCPEGQFKNPNNICKSSCPLGFYGINNICHMCFWNCKECNGGEYNNCTKCHDHQIFYNNQCYDICPDSTYLDEVNFKCKKCDDNCNFCVKAGECLDEIITDSGQIIKFLSIFLIIIIFV
ncbi:hypothetical protein IMG5_181030 [Ichthyophthirius multifiliis]|uniref:EGF-like domain-containing protein n=1 Tax=Ichthyophthirius multifiliis TaxID=5932 RepID=G0R2W3_ICHMU|nr:hypothetical protein IMG5_181030 [Ichthyophthirius multifiliis]EGR28174.1 hypothetical protein IMG5_181030 [Ichthyophthirius multifiliis]|eukprot:XP_004027519.1 hypothetical protein IMG5_181030 [Ichthyophthirius multifiliis]